MYTIHDFYEEQISLVYADDALGFIELPMWLSEERFKKLMNYSAEIYDYVMNYPYTSLELITSLTIMKELHEKGAIDWSK